MKTASANVPTQPTSKRFCFHTKPSLSLTHNLIKAALLTAGSGLVLVGCTSVSIGHRSTASALLAQRTTIVTGTQLSSDTQSRLLQAGLDAESCQTNIPMCVVRLKRASVSGDKGLYAAYSELFYAAALQRRDGLQCTPSPKDLNTDFAKQLTAPLVTSASAATSSATATHTQMANTQADNTTATSTKRISCGKAEQDDLLQAARFAYIYLMYDHLPKVMTANGELDDSDTLLDESEADEQSIDIIRLMNRNHANTMASTTTAVGGQFLVNTATKTPNNTPAKLTPKTPTAPLQYPPNERDIQIQDLYYAAIDALGDSLFAKQLTDHYQINANRLAVTLNGQPFDSPKQVNLISSYQINLSGLNSISRRDGFGISYVALLDDRYTASLRNQILNQQSQLLPIEERIHPLGHLPLTGVLMPKGSTLLDLVSTNQFELALYDPYRNNRINLQGQDFALSANFSASYGLWLNENALEPVSLLNLFSRRHQRSEPHLFMLEPYNPNKRVIIMLHGLGSSPITWIGLTNDIFNDARLRDNYQVWQVFYPTNIPILENRYQIYQLLTAAFKQMDPLGQDPASHHSVIIGHSMGGVIGRMLVSNDNLTTNLANLLQTYDKHLGQSGNYYQIAQMANNQAFNNRFTLSAMPQVDRAVFVSSPFRGTEYADKWFTRGLRRIISLPKNFVQTASNGVTMLFNGQPDVGNPLSGLFLENGASQLSNRSFFVALTKDIAVANHVKVNTLIATDDPDLFDALHQETTLAEAKHAQSNQPTATTGDDNGKKETTAATIAANPNTNLYTTNNLLGAVQAIELDQQLLARVQQGVTDSLSDGIVPYNSARLPNVETEKILTGKHNVQTSPQAILELRRILHRHLRLTGLPSSQSPKTADQQP